MLTVCGRKAITEIKENGKKMAEALAIAEVEAKKLNTCLTVSDYKAICKFEEVKKMKSVVRREMLGYPMRNAKIERVTMGNVINVKSYGKMIVNGKRRKALKATDSKACKVFVLSKNEPEKSEWIFKEESNETMTVTSPSKVTVTMNKETARKVWSGLKKAGFTQAKETKTETAKPCNSKASEEKATKKSTKKTTKKSTAKSTKKTSTKAKSKAKKTTSKKQTAKKTDTKSTRKSTKATDCKVFRLVRPENEMFYETIYTFETIDDKTMKISSNRGFAKEYPIETARRLWKNAIEKGCKRIA